MDQSSLTALLQQLQGLDPPVPAPALPHAAPATSNDDEEDGEVQSHQEDPNDAAIPPALPSSGDVPIALPGSELERLLHSLRPLEELQQASQPTHVDSENAYGSHYASLLSSFGPEAPSSVITAHSGDALRNAPAANYADLRKYTYVQALPIISRLAQDDEFIEKLQQIKSGQEAFELSIVDERNRAKADLEKQLKRAQDASEASGVKYEVDRLQKLLTATLNRFDKDALVRWDALARDQQAKLEALGVPCFYVIKTADPVALERQRRVMETLATLLEEA